MTTNSTMPAYLAGTEMEKSWNRLVELAKEQNVDPMTSAINAESVPPEELQALVTLGAAEVTPNAENKPMVRLKYAMPLEQAASPSGDVTGVQAASKKHTFAQ